MRNLRIGIAGMHIESGTFSPLVTQYDDFLATRGCEMLPRYPWIDSGQSWAEEIDWMLLAHFRAMPGGVIKREAYDRMKTEIVEKLAASELDGFYLDIHGAMTVQGLDDAELDLLLAIRGILGNSMPIVCSQDLHGNVSAELVAHLDAITTYRTAPHVDVLETRERAAKMLCRILHSGERPFRAWVGIPVLLSGEMTSTEVEPGNSLWSGLDELSDSEGVWDVSLWAGYPWADQARAMASVVVTGTNGKKAKEKAEQLAARYWEKREEFQFLSPAMSVNDALQHVDDLPAPVFLSDAGDNPTAGGAGDTTGTLERILEYSNVTQSSVIFASIPDALAVETCIASGVDEEVTLSLGGKLDSVHSQPLEVTGKVIAVSHRDKRMGPEAVLQVGQVAIILSAHRRPYHLREDYLGLGLDPLENNMTVVKIGYLEPELKAMAASHILLLSEGGVNPSLTDIIYENIARPMFPFDQDFEWQPVAQVFSPGGKSS